MANLNLSVSLSMIEQLGLKRPIIVSQYFEPIHKIGSKVLYNPSQHPPSILRESFWIRTGKTPKKRL